MPQIAQILVSTFSSGRREGGGGGVEEVGGGEACPRTTLLILFFSFSTSRLCFIMLEIYHSGLEPLIYNLCFSVAAHRFVEVGTSLIYYLPASGTLDSHGNKHSEC